MFTKSKGGAKYEKLDDETTSEGRQPDEVRIDADDRIQVPVEASPLATETDGLQRSTSSSQRKSGDKDERVEVRLNVDNSNVQHATDADEENDKSVQNEDPNAVTIKVKSTDDNTHEVRIPLSAAVLDLKAKLEQLTSLPKDRQRLIFLGRMLSDQKTLDHYNIKDGVFVHLVPKPAGPSQPPSRSSNADTQNGNGVDSIVLPRDFHFYSEVDPTAIRQRRFSEDYDDPRYWARTSQEFQLAIWRARVRLMSSLMLFFFFLGFMTALSFWMHPEEADREYKPGFSPPQYTYALELMEDVLGMAVGIWGLKTAVEDDTALSGRFFHGILVLAVAHFANLAVWARGIITGTVKINMHPMNTRGHGSQSDDEPQVSVSANVIVNMVLWMLMIYVAARYHSELVHLERSNRNNADNGTPTTTNVVSTITRRRSRSSSIGSGDDGPNTNTASDIPTATVVTRDESANSNPPASSPAVV